jgi:hypothetical protein
LFCFHRFLTIDYKLLAQIKKDAEHSLLCGERKLPEFKQIAACAMITAVFFSAIQIVSRFWLVPEQSLLSATTIDAMTGSQKTMLATGAVSGLALYTYLPKQTQKQSRFLSPLYGLGAIYMLFCDEHLAKSE